MTSDWSLTGDYFETCNCETACQCVWLEEPDGGTCGAALAWHVTEGQYGDVDLADLSVTMLIKSDEGVFFDPDVSWDVVVLVDERASDDQRQALEAIYSGEAGGIFAAIADTHVRSAEMVSAPIEFTRDGASMAIEIGDVLSMSATGATGFQDRPVTVSPHPLGNEMEVQVGTSETAWVDYDEQFRWDVAGNNSYLCDFDLASA